MKFIVDTQLPPRLARSLSGKGHDAIHTTHFKDGHLFVDAEIILVAKREGRAVVSKDADFLDHYVLKGAPPKVLLVEFGNISNGDLINLFDRHLEEVVSMFEEGADLVLFKRDEVVGY